VGEGHVDSLRVYGPDGNTAIVSLKASAPGGARQCKVRVCECVCECACACLWQRQRHLQVTPMRHVCHASHAQII
jgi:hypothetical protein